MTWNDATRRETRAILEKIPPLSWSAVEGLFRDEDRCTAETDPGQFTQIPDPEDRKFAALAHAADAILISLDDHLLGKPHEIGVLVLSPSEYMAGQWATT